MRAVAWLALMRVGVWVLPLQLLRRLSGRVARPTTVGNARRPTKERIVWAVRTAGRLMRRATCLPRALATQALLAASGYAAALRIGVDKTDAGLLEAHAWVECDGEIVVGQIRDLARYVPLPTLPGETS